MARQSSGVSECTWRLVRGRLTNASGEDPVSAVASHQVPPPVSFGKVAELSDAVVREPLSRAAEVDAEVVVGVPDRETEHKDCDAASESASDLGAQLAREAKRGHDRTDDRERHDERECDLVVDGVGKHDAGCQHWS